MPEVTLSELTHIPARETGKPATVIDSSRMVAQLNEAAQFKANNDWKKYQQFLKNFETISQDAQAIAAMDVMPQDREHLDKQRAEIFSIIEKDPRALSGLGPAAQKLKANMSKYMSDATLSKQNNAFDWAHRQLLNQTPEWSTDDNKKIINDFVKQPLGARQQYSLNMPAMVDMGKLLDGVFKDPTVTQTAYGWDKTPDGKFLQEVTTTTLKHDPFMNRWNSAMAYQTDKYGRPISMYAKQLYDQLPDREKKQWQKEDGTPDLDKLWSHIGETLFGSNKDIMKTQKGKIEPNRFEIDKDKWLHDKDKMAQKFGYDVYLKKLGENLREDYRKFAQLHPIAGAKNSNGRALNWMTVSYLQDALANGEVISGVPANIDPNNPWNAGLDPSQAPLIKKVNWSPALLQLFDKERQVGDKVIRISPKDVTIDPDANLNITYDDGTIEKIKPDDFKALIANKYKLTGAFETSGEDLLEHFNTPSLNGMVSNYWDLITSGAYKPKEEKKPEEKKAESKKDKTETLSMDPKDWKQEGNNWRYKDGTLYDATGKKLK